MNWAREWYQYRLLIKQELVHIFVKLGAKDRAHAVMLAVERGLVRTV